MMNLFEEIISPLSKFKCPESTSVPICVPALSVREGRGNMACYMASIGPSVMPLPQGWQTTLIPLEPDDIRPFFCTFKVDGEDRTRRQGCHERFAN